VPATSTSDPTVGYISELPGKVNGAPGGCVIAQSMTLLLIVMDGQDVVALPAPVVVLGSIRNTTSVSPSALV